ncbi:isoaspartyl peptidase/L-asparaginase family protein [Sphingomonas jejuensis]|uniref:isoaspartyl peptidase/L-asparaginase family protein n=1 Tax=Sphingomonas jejuensis TaxID=904715 RepID=UPI001439EF3E|nr:isoaspartyl peptidase/L-asparaginase [Sphingomonas jejuensis]
MSWSLVIHGGAGVIPRGSLDAAADAAARRSLADALDAGSAILVAGGSALDAVEAAVRVLEDAPSFNAGRGAVLTREGTVELDAAIMDGRDRRAGAVAQVTRARHPVSVARAVMERSPHVMLVGRGADIFAIGEGLEPAEQDHFILPERRRQLDELLAGGGDGFDVDMKYGTVGAVARDRDGHVAAATSTGGVMGKRWGRVGDSPLIGAGTFADDRACAVSCTGSGEHFIRAGVAREIAARIRLAGEDPATATATTMADMAALGGTGGVILVDAAGDPLWQFTTAGMYRGRATSAAGRHVAIFGDED